MEKSEKKPKITEEQAKILLEQVKMETENSLKSSKVRGKRIMMMGVILLVAAIIIGVGSWFVLKSMK